MSLISKVFVRDNIFARDRRLKKKKGNKPQFDLREGLFRMTGTDLTRIDGIDVMTATTIISEAG